MKQDLIDELGRALAHDHAGVATEWEAVPAAVLVPLYSEDGHWKLLLTRRTDTVDSHRGQVSFPGGAIEPDDASPAEAALREASEEIGLPANQATIIGSMDSLLTVSQYLVTPVVAAITWPFPVVINKAEVASIFSVPLEWLLNPAHVELRHRAGPMRGGLVPVYYFLPYQGQVIWGVTARIIVDLLDLIRSLPIRGK